MRSALRERNTLRISTADQSLEEKLQRELEQPLIVSHSCDRTKSARRIEIQITCSGLCELWCIGCIKGFSPELKTNRFCEVEVLEDRRVQIVEIRSSSLLSAPTQNRIVRLPDRSGCGRLGKCGRVQPLFIVVRTGIEILSLNYRSKAAKSRGCCHWTVDRKRLATLVPIDKVHRPSSDHRIHRPVCAAQQCPSAANRQLPRTREVKHVGRIGITQSLIRRNPESGKPLCSVLLVL